MGVKLTEGYFRIVRACVACSNSSQVKMLQLLDEIDRRTAAGEAVAVCVVVATRGSTPQGAGAKMLCALDGATVGTLGGGCVEAEVRRRAIELLVTGGSSQVMTYRLDSDYGWDDGLICGGVMDVLVWIAKAQAGVEPFTAIADDMRGGRAARLVLPYERAGERKEYVEELGKAPTLVIAGAGHVGQALAPLASAMGFEVDVIDDRGDVASRQRFPTARRLIVGEVETALAGYPVDASTYVVIVTRGHRHDGRALAAVVTSVAKYVGLIGSKSKIKLIFDELHRGGVSIDALARVHSPIGLNLNAVTVPEIAVSIAAELVAVRREATSTAAMKMNEAEIRRWLGRAGEATEASIAPAKSAP